LIAKHAGIEIYAALKDYRRLAQGVIRHVFARRRDEIAAARRNATAHLAQAASSDGPSERRAQPQGEGNGREAQGLAYLRMGAARTVVRMCHREHRRMWRRRMLRMWQMFSTCGGKMCNKRCSAFRHRACLA